MSSLTHLLGLHHVHLHQLLLVLLKSLLLHNDDLLVVQVLLLLGHVRHVNSRLLGHHRHHGHHGHRRHLRDLIGVNFRGLNDNLSFLGFFGFFVLLLLLGFWLLGFSGNLYFLNGSNLDFSSNLNLSLNDGFSLCDNNDLCGTAGSSFLTILNFRFVDFTSFLFSSRLLLLLTLRFIGGSTFGSVWGHNSSMVDNVLSWKVLDIFKGILMGFLVLYDGLDYLLG